MWRKIETFPCYRVFHADSSAFLIVILKLDFFNDEKLCLKYNYRVVTRYVGSWIKGVGSGIRRLGSGIKGIESAAKSGINTTMDISKEDHKSRDRVNGTG